MRRSWLPGLLLFIGFGCASSKAPQATPESAAPPCRGTMQELRCIVEVNGALHDCSISNGPGEPWRPMVIEEAMREQLAPLLPRLRLAPLSYTFHFCGPTRATDAGADADAA